MTYAVVLFFGILTGYALCYITMQPRTATKQDVETVMVKRTRPSLRNPMRTYNTQYDKFKTKETGLYAPVKPVAKKSDEIEVGQ